MDPSTVIVHAVWAAVLLDTKVVAAGQFTVVGKTPDILTEVAFGKANSPAPVLAAPSVNPEKSTEVTVTFEVSMVIPPATLLRSGINKSPPWLIDIAPVTVVSAPADKEPVGAEIAKSP